MKKSIHYITLGCKANQYDTGAMEALLLAQGHSTTMAVEKADVLVVNSCTVTAESDRKTRQTVRRLRKQNPTALLIVTGCSAQKDGAAYLDMGADVVLGNAHRSSILSAVEETNRGEKRNMVTPMVQMPYEELGPGEVHRTRGYLKIQDGCDRHCTYCIIPLVRGPIRSRKLADIVAEAAHLIARGVPEIVLTGIRLISFGRDTGQSLLDAVDAISQLPGDYRIRLGSLDPDEVDEPFIRRAAGMEKLCNHYHLSLQSGSDTVLKRMGRKYDTRLFAQVVAQLRALDAHVGITADVLTGFVGETEAEHQETMAFVRAMALSRIHVFPYSRRAGTAADKMEGHLPAAIKKARGQALIRVGEELERAFAFGQIGTATQAIFEEQTGEAMVGYTRNYTRVQMPFMKNGAGRLLPVQLVEEMDGVALCRPV
ncbi:tRNA (N(6)-L-threonylcarbamoyladenosine(37)-C(2))-methylthiotransferase MtaB [Eubacteriales bacterium OttesenSCG-928-M02]|nr:tRNA (N(6)-L-threonylcarbamoyladenosine(37)-C(2))-methylthiotransferase MtaB [Eubacteriales bacterium OttesenSCG-928-M02]